MTNLKADSSLECSNMECLSAQTQEGRRATRMDVEAIKKKYHIKRAEMVKIQKI